MPPSISDLEAEVLKLSPEERAYLADRLLTSLVADPAIDDAWAVEVDRRITELESGVVHEIPTEDPSATRGWTMT